MKILNKIMLVLMLVAMATSVHAAVAINETAPDFTLTDNAGNVHSLADYKGKHVVLEWVNYDCPFVKKHYTSNNMQTLQKDLTAKGVIWLSINSSAQGKQGCYTGDELNERIEAESAVPTAYLLDNSGEVGKKYAAKTTPHMFVINPEGALIYQGAIDDTPSFDPDDIPTSTNYVLAAVNESLAGKKVATSVTKSYGCSVKY